MAGGGDDSKEIIRDTGGEIKIPRYAWSLMGVLVVVVVGIITYFSLGRYDHVSPGRYVGPERCKECHPKQYESWKRTKMAKSFNALRPGVFVKEKLMVGLDPDRDYTHDAECLPCHTTGYGLVGGFVSIEETPEMAGVSCEACHGHGGTYVGTVMDPKNPTFRTAEAREAGLIYPPPERVCRECHNERSPYVGQDYKFYYDERVKLGTHEHYHLKYEHGK